MSWLYKISSITFSLEDSHRIAQPQDLMFLSYELSQFARENTGEFFDIHIIQPDGFDDGLTGTINWYVDIRKLSEEDQVYLMQRWIKEKQLMGFQIKMTGPEVSGQNKWKRTNDNILMVYRLHILKNGTAGYPHIPQINISNTNARALLGLLNIPFDYSGIIDLKTLRQRLALITEARMKEFTEDPTHESSTFIDLGRSLYQIQRYIDTLIQMVDFGLSNGFKRLVWA